MSVVTRFAPSPTGDLHIGGARTALFNYLFSSNKRGKFLLRIEDTDKERSTKEAIDRILKGLNWLGLKYDDIVFQSKNLARHKEVAEKLLERDQAYLCYTSSEELEEMRELAKRRGEVFRFKSKWRNKVNSQHSRISPAVRIKAPLEGKMTIHDLVQGDISIKNSELDDLVMLRGDGTPTYMLAVVVDDYDMGVTHVIRGDDHITNAFRQKVIYEAMNWSVPEFAHIPLIHGSDGAKMSKRHGATSVIEYKNMGYLPEVMRNYLLRLGWSHGDAEFISDIQAIEWFSLDKVGKSPSRFDFNKLNSFNKHYIKEKSESDLLELIKPSFARALSSNEIARILQALKFIKEKASLLGELTQFSRVYLDNFRSNFDEMSKEHINNKKSLVNDLYSVFRVLEDWSKEGIKSSLNEFATSRSLKIKDFGPVLRMILTFSSTSTGGIFDVIEVLGKKEVLSRIIFAIENC